jgi:hypothetical protein
MSVWLHPWCLAATLLYGDETTVDIVEVMLDLIHVGVASTESVLSHTLISKAVMNVLLL